eukprot:TRINITY_DN44852_c0_g1_i1.p1 TRINITY_DN44852_c0_g1~~TRINITY_DN44852_c0_g1_i1.p1  ORF type:complete len:508 (+),score=49.91 TRINITY_DN44852_c0_g1_i1:126-1649(+)
MNQQTFLSRDAAIYPGWRERMSPFLAECLGSFVLAACHVYNEANDFAPIWAISSNALLVTALVIAFGHISGANLNPSVSIALCLAGRQTLSVTLLFCFVQIVGATTAIVCVGTGVGMVGGYDHPGKMDIGPKAGFGAGHVFLVEVIFTCMICFVFLNCAASPINNPARDKNGFLGLSLGFCFIAGGQASRHISGSVMNPAIAFGLQLVHLNGQSSSAWASFYLIAEVLGAFLAAGSIRVVRPNESQDRVTTQPSMGFGQMQAVDGGETRSASTAVMAEFVGSFYVALTKVFVHADLSPHEPWAVAAVLASMVYSLRGVSGAHFNPANTIAVGLSGRGSIDFWQGASYIGAQILGTMTAAWVFAIVHSGHDEVFTVRPDTVNASYGAIVLSELLFTFMICYTVLTTSLCFPVPFAASHQNNIAGLAQGSLMMVSGISIGRISGAVLNPAVALGYTSLAGLEGMAWPYVFYEVLGAVIATAAFLTTHPSEQTDVDFWSKLCSDEDKQSA